MKQSLFFAHCACSKQFKSWHRLLLLWRFSRSGKPERQNNRRDDLTKSGLCEQWGWWMMILFSLSPSLSTYYVGIRNSALFPHPTRRDGETFWASLLTSSSFWGVSPAEIPSFGFLQLFGVTEAVWLTAGKYKCRNSNQPQQVVEHTRDGFKKGN